MKEDTYVNLGPLLSHSWVQACMLECIRAYTHMHVCRHTPVHIHMQAHTHACTHAGTEHAHMHSYMHAHMHAHMQAQNMHTGMHTYLSMYPPHTYKMKKKNKPWKIGFRDVETESRIQIKQDLD